MWSSQISDSEAVLLQTVPCTPYTAARRSCATHYTLDTTKLFIFSRCCLKESNRKTGDTHLFSS